MAQVRIQVRRDTTAGWSTSNPVLAEGEYGLETDSLRFKVGDGIRNYVNLPYASGALPATTAPIDVGARQSGTSLNYARADHSHAFPSSVTFSSVTANTATIAGNLSVTGSLIGGTHSHTTANILNWSTASSDAVFSNLSGGSNVTLTRDEVTGVTTISAQPGTSGVSSVSGRTGDILLSASDLSDFPATVQQSGKYLKTDGTNLTWEDPLANGGVAKVNNLTGDVTLAAGSNVTLTVNSATNAITIDATTSSGSGSVTSVNSLVGALDIVAAAGSGLTVTASGSSVTLDASISYNDLTNVPATFTPSSHTHAPFDVTGLVAEIETTVDSLLTAGTNITLTYDEAAHTLTIDAAGASAPTLLAGSGIAIDQTVPGEAEISVVGTLDGGAYEGFDSPTDPPYFSIQPQGQLVTVGTAIFTARLENAESPAFQWERADPGSDTFYSLANTSPYSGVTTETLSVGPVSESDNGGRYRLVATLQSGDTVISDSAVLSTVALVITDQPLPAEFVEADTIKVDSFLMVIADGGTTPYSYQWQQNIAGTWTDMAGETDYYVDEITGTLGASESERVDTFRVKVTDAAGIFVFSDEAEITIRADLAEITLQPEGQPIVSGAATFLCEYQGKGLTVAWEKREAGGADFLPIGSEGQITTPSAGTYRSTLSLSGLTGNDNGDEYRLRVSNDAGDVYSDAAALGASAAIISQHPASATVIENTGHTFTVVASYSDGPLSYQWQEKTPGGSFSDLSGETSSSLALSPANVSLGRDGSLFRCVVTAGGVPTYSKEALLTVISAPAAGDAIFTTQLTDQTVSEGGSYRVDAVSTWLASTDHYAFARVEYDDGTIEYHPLQSGVIWRGTATSFHAAAAHTRYFGALQLWKSAWVTICASTSDPTSYTAVGTTTTMQPWMYAKFNVRNCTSSPDESRLRTGVIELPTTQTLPLGCQGSTLNIPDPPYTYVESQPARCTVNARQAFIGPVPNTGFWDPPTEFTFEGAADLDTDVVLAFSTSSSGMYFRAEKKGVAGWQTRTLPFPFQADRVINCWGNFYVFGRITHDSGYATALVSTDDGRTFEPTEWNFGDTTIDASYAGNKLLVTAGSTSVYEYPSNPYYPTRNIIVAVDYTARAYSKTQNGAWQTANLGLYYKRRYNRGSVPRELPVSRPYPMSYAHGKYFWRTKWSTDAVTWVALSTAPGNNGAQYFVPVNTPDATQSYVLTSNGYRAPAPNGVATAFFAPIANGEPGAGPQAGTDIFFGWQQHPDGAYIYAKGSGNPTVNRALFGHTRYWSGRQDLGWASMQIMSYTFGGNNGPDLDTAYWGPVSEPYAGPGFIFMDDRVIHLFRYRLSSANAAPPDGSIPSPPRR
jgi:hypothetical protein